MTIKFVNITIEDFIAGANKTRKPRADNQIQEVLELTKDLILDSVNHLNNTQIAKRLNELYNDQFIEREVTNPKTRLKVTKKPIIRASHIKKFLVKNETK